MNGWIILLLVVQYLFIGVVVSAVTILFLTEYECSEADGGGAFVVTIFWPIVVFVWLLWMASKPFAFAFRTIYTEMLEAKRRSHENHD